MKRDTAIRRLVEWRLRRYPTPYSTTLLGEVRAWADEKYFSMLQANVAAGIACGHPDASGDIKVIVPFAVEAVHATIEALEVLTNETQGGVG